MALRTTSFSALSGAHASADLPDHELQEGVSPPRTQPGSPRTIFSFPRGARAGSCLHAIFERIDFSRPDHPPLQPLVTAQLELHGIERAWSDVVCAMVRRVLQTPLDREGRIRLDRVGPDRRLVEMGFHYPLAGVERAALIELLRSHGQDGDSALVQTLARLDFGRLQGFMKGFIDLIFELDGRYYLLDYKSNWLGDAALDYGAEQLAEAMTQAGYHLQYLLYVVALHRYLGARLPDYDYRHHFGGVYYLFLRGMEPELGAAAGVFHDLPDAALIEALDRYLAAAEVPR
jgi:exodeoxyribonuclease V beta subunit